MWEYEYISSTTNKYRFFVAALSQVNVSVWLVLQDREEIMEYVGVIEAYIDVSVKLAGNRYFRDKFEFRVQVKGDHISIM